MPARDVFHNTVRVALEKDGWAITRDPLYIKVEGLEFYIDLAVKRMLAAEKAGQTIAVEIKSFLGTSELNDYYLALGQFLTYRKALTKKEPDRILYLGISQDIYEFFFSNPLIQEMVSDFQLKLLIFDPMQEEILLWKE
ncbi:MAG: fatty-acid oxidation protein subunit alpha [Okeania sp. SIO2H7]|nr:fatty-acid oxidation protein subunit alpha [Okeania sp. SIO2H7]